jgi:hypothetical protein
MKAEYDFSKGKRGAVIRQRGKTRISIFVAKSVLKEFRARAQKAGTGYQAMMNEALRRYLAEPRRDVGREILQGIREIKRGIYGRVTRVPMAKQLASRERLKKLRRTARIGDIMSPSGEVWDAERGAILRKSRRR